MLRRLAVAGVTLSLAAVLTPASAQELSFSASSVCTFERDCEGVFADFSARVGFASAGTNLTGTYGWVQLAAKVVPTEQNGWLCGPDRADWLALNGFPPDQGCDDDPDPGVTATPEPASL